jgi:uncharacterized membrane protein YidH (DUF202 family)
MSESASYSPSLLRPLRQILAALCSCSIRNSTPSSHPPLLTHPLAPLLIPNKASDARDHLANERTFLSWLRLGVFMAVVSVAIILSFHLKRTPTPLELRMALPLGLVFWLLALACIGVGLLNYILFVRGYAKRQALVQTGMVTQIVSHLFRSYCYRISCIMLPVLTDLPLVACQTFGMGISLPHLDGRGFYV